MKICLQLKYIVYNNYVKFCVIGHCSSDARSPKPRGNAIVFHNNDELKSFIRSCFHI